MKLTHILAVAGLMTISGLASAAPLTSAVAPVDVAGQSLIEKVHGDHRACEEGRAGWHRHDRYGERIPCERPHYGRPHYRDGYRPYRDGYRPPPPRRCTKDWHCVKSGPFGIEKRCFWRDICN